MKYGESIHAAVGQECKQQWLENIKASDRSTKKDYEIALNEQIESERQRVGGTFKIQHLRLLTDEQLRLLVEAETRAQLESGDGQ